MRPVATRGASMVSPTRELVWDATLMESYTLRSDVTEHEVEDGSSITDHVRKLPPEVELELISTTTPLSNGEPGAYRDQEYRAQLQEIWAADELVTILTESVDADSWVITSISEQIDQATGEACRPRVSLRRVRVAQRQTTEVPPLPVNQRRIAQTVDTGAQQTGEGDADAAEEGVEEVGGVLYRANGGTDEAVGEVLNEGGLPLATRNLLLGAFSL